MSPIRARELQGDADADEIKHIMRRVIDPKTPESLKLDPNSARVAIDALKWSAARRAPKKYGDRIAQELTGKDGGAIRFEEKPPDKLDLARWVADLLLTANTTKEARADDDEEGRDSHELA